MRRTLQNVLGALMVLVLGTSAAYSANFAGFRDSVPPPAQRVRAAAIDRDPATATASGAKSSLRSFPWWAQVATFDGTGPETTDRFTIDEFALQWRAVWTCESGHLLVRAQRGDGEAVGQPLVDAPCPSDGTGFSVELGDLRMDVQAEGPWELVVEEQVDVPLVEPPTAEMEKGRVVATGEIYDMDRRGSGTVFVYRLRDGSTMVRLEDFYITPNVDLEIDVSELERPQTTEEFTSARYERIAMMPVTTGSINYEVPDDVDVRDWESIVIWCEPLHLAYAGATLEPIR